ARRLQTAFYYVLIGLGIFVAWAGVPQVFFLILLVPTFAFLVNHASSRILAPIFLWTDMDRFLFALGHTSAEFCFRGENYLEPLMQRCKDELTTLIDGDVEDFLNREREWRR
ncbi:MAG TPA: hypothetical protein VK171_16560, partial [Fimbriimonas sp.]|nr:hypothetical protein [Fimbriimonas sp.]